MDATSSVIGRLGRRTVLAVVGGVAVVAAAVAIATAAAAGGGSGTPAPSAPSASPSASSSPGKEGSDTTPGDGAWGRGADGCCGGNGQGWNARDDGMEMGRRHMEHGMGMSDG